MAAINLVPDEFHGEWNYAIDQRIMSNVKLIFDTALPDRVVVCLFLNAHHNGSLILTN